MAGKTAALIANLNAGAAEKALSALEKKIASIENVLSRTRRSELAASLAGLCLLKDEAGALAKELILGAKKASGAARSGISELNGAVSQLKLSLSSALAPVISAAAPGLTGLVEQLSSAADAAARLSAQLAGKNYYMRAVKAQKSYAKSLKNTASAAKEAAGSLAAFDEINTIVTEKAKGAAGAMKEETPELFEKVEIEPFHFDGWGDALSSLLDKLLRDGIPRLKSIFSDFANWLNELSRKLYEMFTFPGLAEKVALLGAELANALNGLVAQIDWYALGQALGAGLQLALSFLLAFLRTFDWFSLGRSLAEFVNGMVGEIDWYGVGELLAGGFKIAVQTLAGFLGALDPLLLAEAAGNLVKGFMDSIYETLRSVDWQGIGTQVAQFLINVDWSGVAHSTFRAIGAAFGAAAGFLWGLLRVPWEQVVQWWRETAFENGKFTMQGFLNGMLELIQGIGDWIKGNIFEPMARGLMEAFGIHDATSSQMESLGRCLQRGLTGGLGHRISEPIVGFCKEVIQMVKQTFGIHSPSTVFYSIGQNLAQGLLNGLKAGWSSVTSWINEKVNWLKNRFSSALSAVSGAGSGAGANGKSSEAAGRAVSPFTSYSIPRLARGTVVPPNREFMAVLGDNNRETEVVSPLSTMREAESDALREFEGNQTINLVVDGQTLARVVVPRINSMTRAAGKSVLLV